MAENIPNSSNEEIDLGKLFQVIGQGFKNFFNAIGNLFKTLIHYGILSLIFLRKNIIIIGGATIIGAVSGYLLNADKSTTYLSKMIVETNYKSGHRLYKQLEYLNTLVSEEDTIKLGGIFDVDSSIASKISSFKVEPYDKEKNLKIDYDNYMKYTDTIFTRGFTLQDYEERTNDPDFRKQSISAFSLDKNVFKKLKPGIINLVENDFFKQKHETKKAELKRRKEIAEKDLQVIDSLRVIYKEVAILSAKNSNTPNTNIDLSGKRSSKNKDIELFNQNKNLTYRLNLISNEMLRYNFIIGVVSDFDSGEKYNPIRSKKWFTYAILGFLLSIMAILGLRLNTYLSNYEK